MSACLVKIYTVKRLETVDVVIRNQDVTAREVTVRFRDCHHVSFLKGNPVTWFSYASFTDPKGGRDMGFKAM